MYYVVANTDGRIYMAILTGYNEMRARNWQLRDDRDYDILLEDIPTVSFSVAPGLMNTAATWNMSKVKLVKTPRPHNPDFPMLQFDRLQKIFIKPNPIYNLQRTLADGTPQIRICSMLREVPPTIVLDCGLVMAVGAYQHNPPICQWTQTPRATQTQVETDGSMEDEEST